MSQPCHVTRFGRTKVSSDTLCWHQFIGTQGGHQPIRLVRGGNQFADPVDGRSEGTLGARISGSPGGFLFSRETITG
jgi:hypothetical protein